MSYTVNVEETEPCKLKVAYSADPKVVADKRNEIVSRFRKLPVPGFRPGKATDLALRSHFKNKITELLQQDMLNHAVEDILFETKIETFGNPQPLSASFDGNNFKSEILFLKVPEVTLQGYKGLSVPKPDVGVVDDVVESTLQDLRERAGDLLPYEENDFVQLGDTVTLDYEVLVGTERVDFQEGIMYNVGQNLMPDFDVNLCGMAAGETRDFNVDEIKKCVVNLHMGMKKKPAALDDDLAKRFGVDTLEQLRTHVRSSVEQQQEQTRSNAVKQQIKNKLLADSNVNVPDWLAVAEAQGIASQERTEWETLNELARLNLIDRARQNIALSFILNEIRKAEPETQLTDIELMQITKNVLAQNGVQDVDKYIEQASANGSIGFIISQIKNDYVMNWLVKQANIVE
jgi:trigger factor